MDWQEAVGRLAGSVARQLGDGKREVVRRVYGDRPARVVAYRGYGTDRVAHVRGRVLYGPPIPPANPHDRWWVNLANAYRRLESHEVRGARVRVTFRGSSEDVVADREGHFHARLHDFEPPPSSSLWHDARVELVEPAGTTSTAPVAIPAHPRFGIISDLDDTVLQTDVRNIVRMGREVLFGNAHTRIPFPGVGAFYRALHAGENPVFYVSSSPWNLYDLLSQFLHLHRIPAGPMDLRDWGVGGDSGIVGGHHGHKRQAIDRILGTYPDLRFILVGDSGQEDPEIYRGVVRDHPDRILAIYIRSVIPDPTRIRAVERLREELVEDGSELILALHTLEAAHHAADRGWIEPRDVAAVAQDREREAAEASGAEASGAEASGAEASGGAGAGG